MSKQYRVLVLTDHSGHSDQNSVYSLLRAMLVHQQCASVHVASRGLAINRGFFEAMQPNSLLATKIDSSFGYSEDGACYSEALVKVRPADYDLVFMRLPRPISDDFLLWIHMQYGHAVIVNSPKGIITTSSKEYLLEFPTLCPSMRLCESVQSVLDAAAEYPIVLKPLRAYGGQGILKIANGMVDDGTNTYEAESYLPTIEQALQEDGYLAMKFLSNVSNGDKRILVVNGEIMGASLRLPADGSWLCNVAQGGTSVPAEVSDAERNIIEQLTPALLRHGIVIYGADTLEDDNGQRILSEINTLSIGGFPQAEVQTGRPIVAQTIQKIFEYADSRT